jgi:hypothetical protein
MYTPDNTTDFITEVDGDIVFSMFPLEGMPYTNDHKMIEEFALS